MAANTGKAAVLKDVLRDHLNEMAPLAALIALALCFAFFEPRMFSLENLANIGLQTSLLFVVAVAQMLPIIVRGFDLSIGTVVSLASVLSSMAVVAVASGYSGLVVVAVATAVALGTGVVVGLINGIAISRLRIDPFITTLASFNICLGLALTVSQGIPIAGLPASLTTIFAGAPLFGVPSAILVAVVVVVGGHFLLKHTVLGRALYLVGSNPSAARVAGIRVSNVVISAHVGGGLLTGLAALLLTARVGSGEPTLGGAMLTVQSIVAVVVGGVSLAGGSGTIWNCLVGALFVTILSNGMNIVRANGYAQPMTLGILIIVAGVLAVRRAGRS
ncbi:hypothetical protein ASD00_31255 [Ensifer sp. Root31]|uniref:ABC transporter permease n=1 Tax=Ensifer sp. Root31 TaxID=1736512 RepID=UPI00070EDCB2|nr:ABC transporter permease [Ensifer sp. Root31]KQU86370.1 hypothetical protein ASD00_31255 [Ensifer sp. Root31]